MIKFSKVTRCKNKYQEMCNDFIKQYFQLFSYVETKRGTELPKEWPHFGVRRKKI